MKSSTHIVIMAGGVGSRLYPLSTPEHPKQFLDILECGRTLIQLTYDRFLEVDPDARFWVVTSERYAHFIKEQLPSIPDEQILLEPEPRNTAPCIAYACTKIIRKYPKAVIVNTPADAYVPDTKAFAITMRKAVGFASSHQGIVCIGIKPTEPHTGYGYIKSLQAPAESTQTTSGKSEWDDIHKVEAFKEKPDSATAEAYLRDGNYAWNAGIFVWSAETIMTELRRYAPQICGIMDRLAPSLYTRDEQESLKELFPQCEKISIDYAVMEKSDCIYTIGSDWEWSDLGSFEAIERVKFCK